MATPKTYVKKPVEIQAMQFGGGTSEMHEAMDWMDSNGCPFLVGDALNPEALRYPDQLENSPLRPIKGHYIDPATGALMIRTLEGDMRAEYGDWIIRGVQGEFYPCKPDIFEATYDEVPQ